MSKNTIIHSAKSLFLKFGIKSISMDDIAKDIGMSKKTIYNFVTNKDDLVLSVLQSFIEEEKEIVSHIKSHANNAIEEMASIGKYVIQTMRKMKPTLTHDLKKYHVKSWDFLNKDHFSFIEDIIKSNINRGINEGLYRSELDPEIQAKIYVGLARLIVEEEVFPIKKYERPHIYENVFMYNMNGIMNDKGRKEIKKYLKQDNL
ncbi:MAG: TetR/AcrR family transcriptional regulator [Saprospiraceae bacterium]|nr:TetR/AcrR family transcriptional regulator [Bacteroidia bacterium]NNE15922.1 TetR/AcrR family transcriptional regulator [Saprospiraceae bacterium]NNL91993.1 TetR/AcrR family transcriptional regulator [Saprospiraceae bacterium]